MCFDFDGYCDWYTCKTVIGRKPHRCSGCGKLIEKGERHRVHSGKFEGEVFSERECDDCQRMILSIAAVELENGCEWNTIWCPLSELQTYWTEVSTPVPKLEFETLEECWAYVNELERKKTANAASL